MAAREHWRGRLQELHTAPLTASPEARAAAETAIRTALAQHPPRRDGSLHPAVPRPAQDPERLWTPATKSAVEAVIQDGVGALRGVDLTRYTAIDFDAENDENEEGNGDRDEAMSKENLRRAYVALAYSQIRKDNLDLLSLLGRNQWLRSNDGVEQDLQMLERKVLQAEREAAAVARSEIGM
ncbi:uncharacterized protein V1518DRAFT_419467 [Limtongia smithiae]|uniref:uncharacterized protein n=1 Tax=Limtongia smithiae TaxID=1125753 RepID=UPI0034D008F5